MACSDVCAEALEQGWTSCRQERRPRAAHTTRTGHRERTTVRHHLIERMLSEVFDMAWFELHDEAERLEHAVSTSFEEKAD